MNIKKPLNIKSITLNNRIVMPPMASENTDDGLVHAEHFPYYTDRTDAGHIGLVITEHMYVHLHGKASERQLSIADDACIEGLSKLTAAIKKGGAKVFAQLNHAGSGSPERLTGVEPKGPSPVFNPYKTRSSGVPHEMNHEDLFALRKIYADAALRAKAAGYDGVEIHAAHSYLLDQFYSPILNKRHDEYGVDSIENRVRLHLELIHAVREAVGEDYPIAMRFGGCDYMEGGSTIEDCAEACKLIEKAGVDIIDLSGGLCNFTPKEPDGTVRTGVLFEDMARAVKAVVNVPVILTGGIVDAETAERLISENACDLVGIGRALLKDAKWPENQIYK